MRYDVVVIGNDPRGIDSAMEEAVEGRRVVVVAELDERTAARLDLFGVEVVAGPARFVAADEVEVHGRRLTGCRFVLATGTRAWRPRWVPFDGDRVLAAGEDRDPAGSTIVIGSGRLGVEQAVRLAERGLAVTLVDGPESGFDVDRGAEYADDLERAADLGVRLHLGSETIGVDRHADGVEIELRNGDRLRAESVVFAAGAEANTDELDLPRIGVRTDERGRVWCDGEGRTWVAHVSAVGDVALRFPRNNSRKAATPRVRRPHFDRRSRRAFVHV